MKTTSGAHVFVLGDRVLKIGTGEVGRRIRAQGRYVQALGADVCPKVHALVPYGYVMERLNPIVQPTTFAEADELAQELVNRLHGCVWQPHIAANFLWDFDSRQRHFDYVDFRADESGYDIHEVLWSTFYSIRWDAVEMVGVLTHGDPTFENLMRDNFGALIVTDPLPPVDYMPPLRQVDIAKMMQSLYGYEYLKRGERVPDHLGPGALRRYLPNVDPENLQLIGWFTMAHYVRLLRYQTRDLRPFLDTILAIYEDVVAL